MASNQRWCQFHKESTLSFCLNHGIYCCPHCHATSNVGCVTKTTEEAFEHYINETQKSRVILDFSKKRCSDLRTSFLNLQQELVQERRESTVGYIHTLCNQLRRVVDSFECDAICTIDQVSVGRVSSLENNLQRVKTLSEFLCTLDNLIDNEGDNYPAQPRESLSLETGLNTMRTQLETFRDGLTAVSERLNNAEDLHREEYNEPIYLDKGRVDNMRGVLYQICLDSQQDQQECRTTGASTWLRTQSRRWVGGEPKKPLKPLMSLIPVKQHCDENREPASAVLETAGEPVGVVFPTQHSSQMIITNECDTGFGVPQCNSNTSNMTGSDYDGHESVQSQVIESKPEDSYSSEGKKPLISAEPVGVVFPTQQSSQMIITNECECSVGVPQCNSKTSNATERDYDGQVYVQSHHIESKLEDSHSAELSKAGSPNDDLYNAYLEHPECVPLTAEYRIFPNGRVCTEPSFSKFREVSYTGRDPAVCFVPSTAGHILLATKKPNVLSKFDENGIEMVRRESTTWTNDMCVRGTRIYTTDSDCSVRVLDVETLSSLKTFWGIGVCHGIDTIGDELVITSARGCRKGVHLVDLNSGAINVRSSLGGFNCPLFVTSSDALQKIVVSDVYDNCVMILSVELRPIWTVKTELMRPNGVCITDESVLIACHKSKSVVEYSIDGECSRTIFSPDDTMCSPRTLSYHKESREIVVSSAANPSCLFLFKTKTCKWKETCSQIVLEEMESCLQKTTESNIISRPTYKKLFQFPFTGIDPVARYIQSSPANILLTTKQPNMIRKLSESGEKLLYIKTESGVNDFCVRDSEIYTSDADGIIRVYSVSNISLLRTINCGFQECTGICTIGQGLAVLQKSQDCWHFSRISVTGEHKGTLSRTFNHPLFVALAPVDHALALVTDPSDKCIVGVQGNLDSSCRTISHPLLRRPNGVCTDGVHVYVVCEESKSVLAFHSDGRFRRTVITNKDGLGSPRTLSYHKDSGHFVMSSTTDPKKIIIFASDD